MSTIRFSTEPVRTDENAIKDIWQEELWETRIDIKTQGYYVKALDKTLKEKKTHQAKQALEAGGGGLDLESHPDLPHAEGLIDDIVLPNDEMELRQGGSKEALKHKKKLKHALGGGQDLSEQALKEEYKKKMDMKVKQVLKERPGVAPPTLNPY